MHIPNNTVVFAAMVAVVMPMTVTVPVPMPVPTAFISRLV
jgi:hypothetical protein